MPPTCDRCGGFFDMELLVTEHIVPRNTGYMRIVGKSIWENPSHPSRGLIAKPLLPECGSHPKFHWFGRMQAR